MNPIQLPPKDAKAIQAKPRAIVWFDELPEKNADADKKEKAAEDDTVSGS